MRFSEFPECENSDAPSRNAPVLHVAVKPNFADLCGLLFI